MVQRNCHDNLLPLGFIFQTGFIFQLSPHQPAVFEINHFHLKVSLPACLISLLQISFSCSASVLSSSSSILDNHLAIAVNLSDPWLPKSPKCIPHQTLTARLHDPPLDTQWADYHLHSPYQTAPKLQQGGWSGERNWLSVLTTSWRCTGNCTHTHTPRQGIEKTHTHTPWKITQGSSLTSLWIFACEFVTLQILFSKDDTKEGRDETLSLLTLVSKEILLSLSSPLFYPVSALMAKSPESAACSLWSVADA